jgi:hypothetical protein
MVVLWGARVEVCGYDFVGDAHCKCLSTSRISCEAGLEGLESRESKCWDLFRSLGELALGGWRMFTKMLVLLLALAYLTGTEAGVSFEAHSRDDARSWDALLLVSL